ncbi:MAG: hypothetical protein A2991_02520 [Candidatus Terrybacteria bacterium RIFCSPLOWO2_01_FULL_58_14]|uniref:Uncharacterized protein n=2 Tax=Candidatus Terryibacteriota TaxID=1817920 RepID=A0A1G2PXF6_9BACT|nr:MAG: hypothetical protein A2682_01285 [Candidatus Terrybacteria bacterium RIFCSPHIGHO2_01_FULL_58_15]OHA52973.1 MAG: hypothetical protein A2991_02520 [Candidatus Terrybacteria bacterium RIFCSPLOWO2_01_FULL_58_14]
MPSLLASLRRPEVRRWIYPAALLLFVLVAAWIFTATTRFLLVTIDRALEIQVPSEESARRIDAAALDAVIRKLNIAPTGQPAPLPAPAEESAPEETEAATEESETSTPPPPPEGTSSEAEEAAP